MTAALFFVFAILALGGALGVVLARNPVHSALFLVLTLVSVAVFFLLQDAQLVAAVQVVVYASAIVVLFLFVIMLLGVDRTESLSDPAVPADRCVARGGGGGEHRAGSAQQPVARERSGGAELWRCRVIAALEITGGYYLVVAALMFAIGSVGMLVRRNALVMFMCVELMLNAVNITFVTFAKMLDDISGQVMVFFTLVVAAAEVAVGLAIIVAIFRRRRDSTADDLQVLKG